MANHSNVAQNVRSLRESRKWTQAQLAKAAGVTERTIQRIESGTPVLAESLLCLAAAFDVPVDLLQAPTPEQVAAENEAKRVLSERTVVPLRPIGRASDFEPLFGGIHAHRIDRVPLTTTESEDAYAELQELVRDIGDIWSDVEVAHRMDLIRSLQPTLDTLTKLGFVVSAGTGDLHSPALRMNVTCLFVFVSTADEPKLAASVPKKMDFTFP